MHAPKTVTRSRLLCLPLLLALAAPARLPWTDEEYLDILPHPGGGLPMPAVAAKLPYAYYPSENRLEVALAPSAEQLKKAGDPLPPEAKVYVVSLSTGATVGSGAVAIDASGWGRGMVDLPDLPDGTYRVEYYIGKAHFLSPVPFVRKHFPFETFEPVDDHTVYPPFEPVRVDGAKVEVVERTYTMNAFGLFDSVVSVGRELLAGPAEIRAVGEEGPLAWRNGSVAGRSLHEDQAVFESSVESDAVRLTARTDVYEDGFAHVELTLLPADPPARCAASTWISRSGMPRCRSATSWATTPCATTTRAGRPAADRSSGTWSPIPARRSCGRPCRDRRTASSGMPRRSSTA